MRKELRVCIEQYMHNLECEEADEMRKPTEAGFQQIADRFKVLSDPMRLKILFLLQSGPHSVGEVADALECPQPTASRQLAKLQSAGILSRERDGTTVHYSIADRSTLRMCDAVCGNIAKSVERQAVELFEPA